MSDWVIWTKHVGKAAVERFRDVDGKAAMARYETWRDQCRHMTPVPDLFLDFDGRLMAKTDRGRFALETPCANSRRKKGKK